MTKRLLPGVVVCGALLAAGSLHAHHSLAGTYDLTRTGKSSGVIQKVAFTVIQVSFNPSITAATWASSGR